MRPSRRVRFAAPIVVTLAAACSPGPYEELHVNPPPPAQEPTPTATATPAPINTGAPPPPPRGLHVNPPPPPGPAGAKELPQPSGKLPVTRLADGTCVEEPERTPVHCHPGATCNPPPPPEPRQVACPAK